MSRRLYLAVINTVDKYVPTKLQPLWNHEAGPKTIFFWAPLGKWGLVLAGLGDTLNRPAHLISIKQAGSIGLTGVIYSRFAVTIKPVNYNLMSVNMFVALTSGIQLAKAAMYQYTHKEN